jgi:hypothetical protein
VSFMSALLHTEAHGDACIFKTVGIEVFHALHERFGSSTDKTGRCLRHLRRSERHGNRVVLCLFSGFPYYEL